MTFSEVQERARRIAGMLARGGLQSGDRIAIYSRNRPEVIEIATAASRSGIIPVPVNALLTENEVSFLLEDSGARWLFTDSAAELRPPIERIVTFGDAFERTLAEADPVEVADHVLTRPMHYTSGTTGSPKGVYVAPVDPDRAARVSGAFIDTWALAHDDVHLVCSPLAHSAPLRFSVRTLEAGGAVVVQERFDPETTLAAIELFAVTSLFMVPTHLERILALGRKKIARFDLSTVRLLAHAGAPIHEEVKRAVLDVFPPNSVWEFYGSTEGQATRISTPEWLRKPGSVGQAYPGTKIYVMDEDFNKVPAGSTGQIWILDPQAEEWEYWGDPGKTSTAWRDGAFTVGDLGYLDDDGYLYLSGRVDDTIISGGVNVYPAEVEQVLATHPAISEVLVFGAPSDEWGQEVRAQIVLAPGASLDDARLVQWCESRLAPFKRPKQVEIVASIPRTSTGKPKRPSS